MMEDYINMWTVLLLYVLGAVFTNIVINHYNEDDMETASVNIASALWPITWAIYVLLVVETGIKKLFKR